MCGCGMTSPCWGGCPCGCKHTGDPNARYLRDHRGFVGSPNPEQHDSSARPVVVIDPEDRKQVARLADAFCAARWSHIEGSDECDPLTRSSMEAALREFANPMPPKPDEPLGLGAVVEDSNGDHWVRMEARIADFHWFAAGNTDRSRAYRNIAAVRVLSEGVALP